jgi:hypothetical protein
MSSRNQTQIRHPRQRQRQQQRLEEQQQQQYMRAESSPDLAVLVLAPDQATAPESAPALPPPTPASSPDSNVSATSGLRRFAASAIALVASLAALQLSVLAWRSVADREPDHRAAREHEINRWIREDLGSPQALILTTGEIHHSFWSSKSWQDLFLLEPGKPAAERNSRVRLTYNGSGRIISAIQQPLE